MTGPTSAQKVSYPEALWAWMNMSSPNTRTQERPAGLSPAVRLHRHPSQIGDCIDERLRDMPEIPGEAIHELIEKHREWGADGVSLNSIRKLSRCGTVVVVTGQQPGLAAGPLLVLYKAIAAVRLARDLEKKREGKGVVPVFWVASEDHDLEEIRNTSWLGREGSLVCFAMDNRGMTPGAMVGGIQTNKTGPQLSRLVHETTHSTEYRSEVLDWIENKYGSGYDIESAFCSTLLRLLRGSGLVIVSPFMNWVQQRAVTIAAKELEHPGESTREILCKAGRIRDFGFKPTLHRREMDINLFRVRDGGVRQAIRLKDKDTCLLRDVAGEDRHEREIHLADLRNSLKQPGGFSMNVVTRLLLQDTLLPTVAQVVGPGEATYLVQVEAVYERFGAFRPVRWPRPEVMLLEPRVKRFLEKMGLPPDIIFQGAENDIFNLLSNRLGADMGRGRIESLKVNQLADLCELKSGLKVKDPSVCRAVDRLIERVERGYAVIHDRFSHALRENDKKLRDGLLLNYEND